MSRYEALSEFDINISNGGSSSGSDAKLDGILANQKIIISNQKLILDDIAAMKENNTALMAKFSAVIGQLSKRNVDVPLENHFPIKHLEQLKRMDTLCEAEHKKYVQLIKTIISPNGLAKNIHRLLDAAMIMTMNYGGISHKVALKEYKNLDRAIFDALQREGFSEKEYVGEMRAAIRSFKGAYYKKKCEERKRKLTAEQLEKSTI